MNTAEQINTVINNLSDKLGVAAEKVYPMLIKQAYIEGITSLLWIVISVVIVIIFSRIAVTSLKNPEESEYSALLDWTVWTHIKIWFSTALTVAFSIVFIDSISKAITALGNPEWYAIQMILEKVTGK